MRRWKDTPRPDYGLFADYYDGRHQLRFASKDYETKYADLVKSLRENLCPGVVHGFTDSLKVKSWGDKAAVDKATEQGLSRLLTMVNNEAFRAGDAYTIVWPNRKNIAVPTFTRARDGMPTVDDTDPSVLSVFVKRWIDGAGHGRTFNVYPDHAERWITKDRLRDPNDKSLLLEWPDKAEAWTPYEGADGDGGSVIRHTFDGLPVCWWRLDASDVDDYGRSILTDVIPLQDALNKSVADMVITSEVYAKPFWYLLKYKGSSAGSAAAPVNPFTKPEPTLSVNPAGTPGTFDRTSRSVFATDAEGPFGQLDPPDLTRLLKVQDGYALKVARTVGIPAFYFTMVSTDAPSGESLRVLNERRTSRVSNYQEAHIPVLRGLAQLLGIENPEPVWAPVNTLDPAEMWTIIETMRTLGISMLDALRMHNVPDAEGIVSRMTSPADGTLAAAAGAAMRQGTLTF